MELPGKIALRRTSGRHIAAAFEHARGAVPPASGPLVSIVVPAYDDELFVARSVGSCLAQTYANIEIVCVDDGSGDGTRGALERLARGDEANRVKVVALERNSGAHNARRAGLERASGQLVLFLDADDELTPDACARIVVAAQRFPEDILHFATRVRRDGKARSDEALEVAAWTAPVEGPLAGKDILSRSFVDGDYSFNVAGKAFRIDAVRRAFEALGPIDADFGEDALEYFAIGYFAQGYRGFPGQRIYVYHLGDGLSARHDLTAGQFARTLRGIRAIEGMRAFLEGQGALEGLADVYEAHRSGQLAALLASWRRDVRVQDRLEVLDSILQAWPRDEVFDALCNLGSAALDDFSACTGDTVSLTDEQAYRCGRADGEIRVREEFEESGAYRLGRALSAFPRAMRSVLMR